jgi:hypothetical protein
LLGLELWFLFRCGVIFQFIKDVLAIILFSWGGLTTIILVKIVRVIFS